MENTIPAQGSKAPEFALKDHDGREVRLGDFRGKWLVLYFYPRDNTGGCTTEAREFSDRKDEFEKLGAVIAGVSRDTRATHRSFREKNGLTITLLSDPDHLVHEAYGAWRFRANYGREYLGAARSTFLISPEGIVEKVWPNVKVTGHVAAVLEAVGEAVG